MLFLIWMRRVYGNAVATGFVRIRLSPRWVVGTFFVPGVNVLWPFLVIREIWSASGPEADSAIQRRSTPAWLAWWWGLFVFATVLDPGLWRLVEDTSTRFSLGLPSLLLVVGPTRRDRRRRPGGRRRPANQSAPGRELGLG